MEDNYLIVREYEERIYDSKSSKHLGFIEFKHSNGKFYFAWVKDQKIFMRSEGYATASSRDQGMISVINVRWDKNNYRTESSHGVHFLILLAANNKEIARSYPMREEIETFIALNGIDEKEESISVNEEENNIESKTDEINIKVEENINQIETEAYNIDEEKIENAKTKETIPTPEEKEENYIEEVETKIIPESNEVEKPKLISSPLLDSFKNEVKSESIQTLEFEVEVKNKAPEISIVSENVIDETKQLESIASPILDLDYFDEDKQVNIEKNKPYAEIIEAKKGKEEKIEPKIGSIFTEEEKPINNSFWRWFIWLLLLALLGGILWWLFQMDGCQQVKKIIPMQTATIDTLSTDPQAGIKVDIGKLDQASIQAKAAWENTLGGMIAIRLPDGSLINVPENGTEKKLVEYLEAKCGTSEIKKTWFDMDRILFQSGTDKLKEISDEQITLLAKIFKSYPKKKFKIGGYTDNVGDPEANIRLSAIRAAAATRAIAAKGIDSARMRYEGYGQEHPLCPANDTEECRAKNRRVAIRVDVCE